MAIGVAASAAGAECRKNRSKEIENCLHRFMSLSFRPATESLHAVTAKNFFHEARLREILDYPVIHQVGSFYFTDPRIIGAHKALQILQTFKVRVQRRIEVSLQGRIAM